MGKKIENKREEKKEARKKNVTAVILKEIYKKRLIYPELLEAVRKELPEDQNLKDKEFGKILGEMSAEGLVDAEVTQGYYKWFLTTKGRAAAKELIW